MTLLSFKRGGDLLNACNLRVTKFGNSSFPTCVSKFFENFHEAVQVVSGDDLIEQAPLMYQSESRIDLSRLLTFIRGSLVMDPVIAVLQVASIGFALVKGSEHRGCVYLALDWFFVVLSIIFTMLCLFWFF